MTTDPTSIHPGHAANMQSSAESLLDDAAGYLKRRTPKRAADLIASMRIMRHRIETALREMGCEE